MLKFPSMSSRQLASLLERGGAVLDMRSIGWNLVHLQWSQQ